MISFIKNSNEKKKWLFASTLLNIFIAGLKLSWGYWMNSTLVTADGIHSISDVFGAFLIFLALHFANHKSVRFPYGLHKLEDMAAFLGGIGILFAGYEIVHSVFFEKGIQTPDNIWMTIGFIFTIIAIQYIFYFFELKASKRLDSPGVKADAINWLGDIGAGFIVMIGLIAHHFSIPYAEETAVIIIIVMILKGAYDVLKEGLLSLLDAINIEVSHKMEKIILKYSDIKEIKRIMVRKSGSVYFADIELIINDINIKKAHDKIDFIVQELHRNIDTLESVTIHYEPAQTKVKTIIILLEKDKQSISMTFGTAPFIRKIKQNLDSTIISDKVIENPIKHQGKGKAFYLVAWILKENINTVVLKENNIDENIRTLFDALGIELKNELRF